MFAVQPFAANPVAMMIFALALAASEPASLTDVHQRDIACVGVMALIANDQRRKADGYDLYPDVQKSGALWADIVGQRVMRETGLPQEIVGIAMTEAAKAEQNRVTAADEPRSVAMNRFLECQPLMQADLSAPIAVVETEAFPGVDWGSDEPAKLAQMRADLVADRADGHRANYCLTTLRMAHNEIAGREGKDSRDAKAMGWLVAGLTSHAATFPLPTPGAAKQVTADELFAELDKEPSREEQMARCIRLGQWAATHYNIAQ